MRKESKIEVTVMPVNLVEVAKYIAEKVNKEIPQLGKYTESLQQSYQTKTLLGMIYFTAAKNYFDFISRGIKRELKADILEKCEGYPHSYTCFPEDQNTAKVLFNILYNEHLYELVKRNQLKIFEVLTEFKPFYIR